MMGSNFVENLLVCCSFPYNDRGNEIMSVILATAGYDHKIRFWEAPSGVCSRVLKYPDSQVNKVCRFFLFWILSFHCSFDLCFVFLSRFCVHSLKSHPINNFWPQEGTHTSGCTKLQMQNISNLY